MGEPTPAFDDPHQYVVKRDVAIFDAHEECDDKGKVVRKFDRDKLQLIADRCNERDAQGNYVPLSIGHTKPGAKDEREQPELIGAARHFKVRYDKRLDRYVIAADYYIRADKFDEARTFPRTSVELWPDKDDLFFDPIALIRRTPRRSLGVWHAFARANGGKTVIRYAMAEENDMNDDLPGGDAPGGDPPADMPGGDPAMSPDEMAHQYARHCLSHPHLKSLSSHYAKMDAEAQAPPAPEHDPAMPPSADAHPPMPGDEPMRNGMAIPGPTNAFPADKKPEQHSRGVKPVTTATKTVQQQVIQDAEAVRYARQQREIDELKAVVAALQADKVAAQQDASTNDARRRVTQLIAEGYPLDADKEVVRFSKLDASGRDEREEDIRTYARPDPTGGARIPVLQNTKTAPRGEVEFDPEDPENTLSEQDQQKVYRYQREHNVWDLTEAVHRVFPQRFARNQN
jgi:hypothetical protein